MLGPQDVIKPVSKMNIGVNRSRRLLVTQFIKGLVSQTPNQHSLRPPQSLGRADDRPRIEPLGDRAECHRCLGRQSLRDLYLFPVSFTALAQLLRRPAAL